MSQFFNDFSDFLNGRSQTIVDQVISDAKGDADTRMAIYKNAYRQRLIGVLADDFHAVYQILGDDTFVQLGTRYLQRYPSYSHSVGDIGQHLAKFLSETQPYADYPYLWQTADFSWAKKVLFTAPDNDAIVTLKALESIPESAWPTVTFTFIHALKRLSYNHTIPQLCQALDDEKTIPEPKALETPQAWIMWRKDFHPHWQSLDDSEDAFFIRARQGKNFEQLCQVLKQWHADDDIPLHAARMVRNWIDQGMLAAITVP